MQKENDMNISIIIPCYNAIGKIEACISSLEEIDYPTSQYEVIFVDDYSKDETFFYLQNQIKKHHNWRLLQMSKNSGSPSEPRNLGVSNAYGEYIFFLDCDDEILNDTLSIHFNAAINYNADIVRGYLIVDDGNKRFPANKIQGDLEHLNKKEIIEAIIKQQSTTVPTLIKKELLENNKIKWRSDLRMGEDTIYLLELLSCATKIIYIDHPTFVYNKKINEEASSTQVYGARELRNHLVVWRTAQEKLNMQGIDYYKIRLQVGLQTAIQSMISYNSFDIDEISFTLLANFINENKTLISTFNYGERIKGILHEIYQFNYQGFIHSIKQRMVISGYDLKFIKPVLPNLEKYYQIQIDEWNGHNSHNVSHSEDCLKWGEIIFCEWMLGNAVWYSHRVKPHQKLFIRMHRFELTTDWFKQIDFTKVNRVFAVSVYFFEKLIQYTAISRTQACLLPNYLDSNNYIQSSDKNKLFNLGIIGILPSRKGYLNALIVLKNLVAKNKKYRLFVYGKMPNELSWIKSNSVEMAYFNECQQFIQKNGLESNVIIKGWADVKSELKDVGFILSTSDNEEIPESFHIAPADGFASGNQGLLLNWNGVEYIYPNKYIFGSIEEMTHHILKQNSLSKFNSYRQEGLELINERYSIDSFVQQLRKQIRMSVALFPYAPTPRYEANLKHTIIANIQNQKLTTDGIIINLPADTHSNCRLLLEYSLGLSDNTKINAALIALQSNNTELVAGFKMSDIKHIGLYKYLNTTDNGISQLLDIPLSQSNQVSAIKLMLWQKDTEIHVNSMNVIVL